MMGNRSHAGRVLPWPQPGFTLLELLASIAVFSVIAVAAYSLIDVTMTTEEKARAASERLAQYQKLFLFLERDIEQAVSRETRDDYGESQPAMQSIDESTMEFTRLGWINPGQYRPRSQLQRVRYDWVNGVVRRSYWRWPDLAIGAEPVIQPLLDKVDGLKFRYLQKTQTGMQWQDEWPPESYRNEPGVASRMPLAVEVTLMAADMQKDGEGKIVRFFRVPQSIYQDE